MKTMFARLVVVIGCLAVLSARADNKPLRIWISSFQDKAYYEDMIRLYTEKGDASFRAEVEAFGFREMPDKLMVAAQTGLNTPDIVQLDEVLFGVFLAGEPPFVDLTSRIHTSGLGQEILPSRLPLFSSKDKIYGVPQSVSAMVLYYRRDLFQQYGIDPASLTTWDEFVKIGERLYKEKDQALLAIDPTYFEVLLRQQGSDIFGDDGNAFPDPKLAKDTLTWLQTLQNSGIGLQPERGSIFDPLFFSSSIDNDRVLCVIGADWYGMDIMQQFSPELKGKWGALPLPAWTRADGSLSPRTSTFAGQGLLIHQQCVQVDAAWKFVEFVMRDREANVRRFTQGNSFPAHMPSWEDPRMHQPVAYFADQPFGRLLAELAPSVPSVVMHPRRPMAVFMFQESFFASFMYGQLTAEEVVAQMKDALEKP